MTAALSRAAAFELRVYRAAASIYRGALAARLLAPLPSERRRMLEERLGRWGMAASIAARPCVWLHAASLGETLTAAPLIARLRSHCPHARIVLTTNTAAGLSAASDTAADEIHFFPVDTPDALDRIIGALRPRLFVSVETEIWPSLLLHLAERGIAAAMVNGSVSARSHSRYLRVRALMSAALGTLAAVAVRDQVSHERLISLGASPERTRVTGDLKIDATSADRISATPDSLAPFAAQGNLDQVLLAGSTHEGEDETVLGAFSLVRARHPGARLVLAPRHSRRASAVATDARARGFGIAMWSERRLQAPWDVLIVDTTGELRGFMKRAAGAFVGGSLTDVGGHNLLEPAAFGLPIATGACLDGVREQADLLEAAGALSIVADERALAATWTAWLDDPEAARERGARVLAALRQQAGALERTWSVLAPLLTRVGVCAVEERGSSAVAG